MFGVYWFFDGEMFFFDYIVFVMFVMSEFRFDCDEIGVVDELFLWVVKSC